MAIRGIEKMSLEEVEAQLREGACFVFYEYCISLVVITLRRPSAIYFLPPPREQIWLFPFWALLYWLATTLTLWAVYWSGLLVYWGLGGSEPGWGLLKSLAWVSLLAPLGWLLFWSVRTSDGRWRDETGLKRGIVFSALSLLCGWWGVPWGLVYTPMTVFTNLCGGQDVTDEVWALLQSDET